MTFDKVEFKFFRTTSEEIHKRSENIAKLTRKIDRQRIINEKCQAKYFYLFFEKRLSRHRNI